MEFNTNLIVMLSLLSKFQFGSYKFNHIQKTLYMCYYGEKYYGYCTIRLSYKLLKV
jgi:hypothetical protein